MKKKRLVGTIVVLAGFVIACLAYYIVRVSRQEEEPEQKTMYLAEMHGVDYVTTQADLQFAKLVDEATDGRIKIQVKTDGILGDETSVAGQIKGGKIEFARVSIAPVAEYVDELHCLMLPYLFESDEQMWNSLTADIGEELLDCMSQNGIIGLSWYYSGARSFYTRNEIESVSDLRNQKIRVQNSSLMFAMCETIRCIPKFVDENEVSNEIMAGTIDGAENNILTYYSYGQYEVCPYYIEDEHNRIPDILIASKLALSDVSEEDMAIIQQCATQSGDYERKLWTEQEEDAKELLITNGVQFIEMSDDDRKQLADKFDLLYDEFASDYIDIVQRIRQQ